VANGEPLGQALTVEMWMCAFSVLETYGAWQYHEFSNAVSILLIHWCQMYWIIW